MDKTHRLKPALLLAISPSSLRRGRISPMPHAWVRRQLPGFCLAFALWVMVCVLPAAAQQSPKPRATPVPRLILLPPKVVARAQATLAVLDSQGRLLPGISLELSGGQKITTDLTGRALFKAPDQPGTLMAKVAGQSLTASTSVIEFEKSVPQSTPKGTPGGVVVASYPHILALHDRFTLEGTDFQGAADSNRVYLNGDSCLIAASSPVSLVVLPGPHVPIGDITLHVTAAGVDAGQFPATAVLLEFSGPPDTVDAGSTGKLLLTAHGTNEPLLVEVRNGSPGVIQLSKGNVQRVKTSGGEENSAPVEVKFVTGGNYYVTARLLSEDANLPDLASAKMRLAEARKIASGEWPARIDHVLLKMDQAPQDLPQIRAELKSLLDDKPTAPLAPLLASAWRVLN